eukprot:jgi/Galph1/5395/GphlegSOOS_G4004.1
MPHMEKLQRKRKERNSETKNTDAVNVVKTTRKRWRLSNVTTTSEEVNNILPTSDRNDEPACLETLEEVTDNTESFTTDKKTLEYLGKDWNERNRGYANAGIIEKVLMVNFMCHRSFEVKFGPNVNIIHGQNGSGKSAVVAAIQLALGSKALSTERGHSLSDLIMQGADYASILVQIKNKAPEENKFDNRYCPDVFKDAIIIRRKILRNGASEWTLLNGKKEKVTLPKTTTARQEIERIVQHFNIMVENPTTILPQQKCKELLHSKKEEDLYRLFMEATRLKNYEINLQECEKRRLQWQSSIAEKLEMIPSLKRRVEKLHKEKSSMEDAEQLNTQLKALTKEYAWSVVTDLEREMTSYREKEETLRSTIEDKKASIEELKAKLAEMDHTKQATERETDELAKRVALLEETKNHIETELKQKKDLLEQHESDYEHVMNTVVAQRANLSELKEDLRNVDQDFFYQSKRKAEVEEEEKKLHLDHIALENERELLVKDIERLEVRIADVEREIQGANDVAKNLQSEVNQVRKELAELRRMRENKWNHWGESVSSLKEEIDRYVAAGKFHRPPIGPIGAFISVRNKKWALAIQECIGLRLLRKFIVHDIHDNNLLHSIFQRLKVHAGTVICNLDRDRYKINSTNARVNSYPTILSELHIDHDSVYNVLIDLCDIDMNYLFQTFKECKRVAELNFPEVKCCWCVDGSRVFIKNGALFSRSVLSGARQILEVSLEEEEKKAMTRLGHIREELRQKDELMKEKRHLQQDYERQFEALTSKRKALLNAKNDLERKQDEVHREWKELSSIMDRNSLSERIDHLNMEKDKNEERLQQLEKDMESLKKEIADKKKLLKDKLNDVNTLSWQYDKLASKVPQIVKEYKQVSTKEKEKSKELEEDQASLAKVVSEISELDSKLQKETEKTTRLYGVRVELSHGDTESLRSEIETVEEQVRTMRERNAGRSVVQVTKELKEATGKLETTQNQLCRLQQVVARLSENLTAWNKAYVKMHKRVGHTVQAYFGLFMSHRGHVGELKLSRKRGTLDMRVSVASQSKNDGSHIPTKDLKSLSGGERSYTTLSFMLALGEAFQVPFRIFDEFDVFMDEANRHTAYQIIFEDAQSQRSRQFIFLTPLQLPSVTYSGNDVRLITLQPPSRGSVCDIRQQLIDESVN